MQLCFLFLFNRLFCLFSLALFFYFVHSFPYAFVLVWQRVCVCEGMHERARSCTSALASPLFARSSSCSSFMFSSVLFSFGNSRAWPFHVLLLSFGISFAFGWLLPVLSRVSVVCIYRHTYLALPLRSLQTTAMRQRMCGCGSIKGSTNSSWILVNQSE